MGKGTARRPIEFEVADSLPISRKFPPGRATHLRNTDCAGERRDTGVMNTIARRIGRERYCVARAGPKTSANASITQAD